MNKNYSNSKVVLIACITGQDGSCRAELLLCKGYVVPGIKRHVSSFSTDRIDHLYQDPYERGVRLHLHYGDLTDATNLIRIVQPKRPSNTVAMQLDVKRFSIPAPW